MRLGKTVAACILASTACASVASAYYHYTHYNTRTAPFVPVVEKFDLNALPNKTATYFISELNDVQLAPGDSIPGLVSQIRAAARVWNSVETSELRIAYGGIIAPTTQQSSPPIQIMFGDVPPGILAM